MNSSVPGANVTHTRHQNVTNSFPITDELNFRSILNENLDTQQQDVNPFVSLFDSHNLDDYLAPSEPHQGCIQSSQNTYQELESVTRIPQPNCT